MATGQGLRGVILILDHNIPAILKSMLHDLTDDHRPTGKNVRNNRNYGQPDVAGQGVNDPG